MTTVTYEAKLAAFEAGFNAYEADKPAYTNPYKPGSVLATMWSEGFEEAYCKAHDI